MVDNLGLIDFPKATSVSSADSKPGKTVEESQAYYPRGR